ncbi:hypothetical protein NDA14_002780 [Ustilago hordei]|nr:hypothetical protein NDA14_002780 [Ustilago hordei]
MRTLYFFAMAYILMAAVACQPLREAKAELEVSRKAYRKPRQPPKLPRPATPKVKRRIKIVSEFLSHFTNRERAASVAAQTDIKPQEFTAYTRFQQSPTAKFDGIANPARPESLFKPRKKPFRFGGDEGGYVADVDHAGHNAKLNNRPPLSTKLGIGADASGARVEEDRLRLSAEVKAIAHAKRNTAIKRAVIMSVVLLITSGLMPLFRSKVANAGDANNQAMAHASESQQAAMQQAAAESAALRASGSGGSKIQLRSLSSEDVAAHDASVRTSQPKDDRSLPKQSVVPIIKSEKAADKEDQSKTLTKRFNPLEIIENALQKYTQDSRRLVGPVVACIVSILGLIGAVVYYETKSQKPGKDHYGNNTERAEPTPSPPALRLKDVDNRDDSAFIQISKDEKLHHTELRKRWDPVAAMIDCWHGRVEDSGRVAVAVMENAPSGPRLLLVKLFTGAAALLGVSGAIIWYGYRRQSDSTPKPQESKQPETASVPAPNRQLFAEVRHTMLKKRSLDVEPAAHVDLLSVEQGRPALLKREVTNEKIKRLLVRGKKAYELAPRALQAAEAGAASDVPVSEAGHVAPGIASKLDSTRAGLFKESPALHNLPSHLQVSKSTADASESLRIQKPLVPLGLEHYQTPPSPSIPSHAIDRVEALEEAHTGKQTAIAIALIASLFPTFSVLAWQYLRHPHDKHTPFHHPHDENSRFHLWKHPTTVNKRRSLRRGDEHLETLQLKDGHLVKRAIGAMEVEGPAEETLRLLDGAEREMERLRFRNELQRRRRREAFRKALRSKRILGGGIFATLSLASLATLHQKLDAARKREQAAKSKARGATIYPVRGTPHKRDIKSVVVERFGGEGARLLDHPVGAEFPRTDVAVRRHPAFSPRYRNIVIGSAITLAAAIQGTFLWLAIRALKKQTPSQRAAKQQAEEERLQAGFKRSRRPGQLSKRMISRAAISLMVQDFKSLANKAPLTPAEKLARAKRLRKYARVGAGLAAVKGVESFVVYEVLKSYKENKRVKQQLQEIKQQQQQQQTSGYVVNSYYAPSHILSKRFKIYPVEPHVLAHTQENAGPRTNEVWREDLFLRFIDWKWTRRVAKVGAVVAFLGTAIGLTYAEEALEKKLSGKKEDPNDGASVGSSHKRDLSSQAQKEESHELAKREPARDGLVEAGIPKTVPHNPASGRQAEFSQAASSTRLCSKNPVNRLKLEKTKSAVDLVTERSEGRHNLRKRSMSPTNDGVPAGARSRQPGQLSKRMISRAAISLMVQDFKSLANKAPLTPAEKLARAKRLRKYARVGAGLAAVKGVESFVVYEVLKSYKENKRVKQQLQEIKQQQQQQQTSGYVVNSYYAPSHILSKRFKIYPVEPHVLAHTQENAGPRTNEVWREDLFLRFIDWKWTRRVAKVGAVVAFLGTAIGLTYAEEALEKKLSGKKEDPNDGASVGSSHKRDLSSQAQKEESHELAKREPARDVVVEAAPSDILSKRAIIRPVGAAEITAAEEHAGNPLYEAWKQKTIYRLKIAGYVVAAFVSAVAAAFGLRYIARKLEGKKENPNDGAVVDPFHKRDLSSQAQKEESHELAKREPARDGLVEADLPKTAQVNWLKLEKTKSAVDLVTERSEGRHNLRKRSMPPASDGVPAGAALIRILRQVAIGSRQKGLINPDPHQFQSSSDDSKSRNKHTASAVPLFLIAEVAKGSAWREKIRKLQRKYAEDADDDKRQEYHSSHHGSLMKRMEQSYLSGVFLATLAAMTGHKAKDDVDQHAPSNAVAGQRREQQQSLNKRSTSSGSKLYVSFFGGFLLLKGINAAEAIKEHNRKNKHDESPYYSTYPAPRPLYQNTPRSEYTQSF